MWEPFHALQQGNKACELLSQGELRKFGPNLPSTLKVSFSLPKSPEYSKQQWWLEYKILGFYTLHAQTVDRWCFRLNVPSITEDTEDIAFTVEATGEYCVCVLQLESDGTLKPLTVSDDYNRGTYKEATLQRKRISWRTEFSMQDGNLQVVKQST